MNGAGKSLSSVIAGKEDYEVTGAKILFEGEEIGEDAPEERAHKGIFLSSNILWKSLELPLPILSKPLLTRRENMNGLEEMGLLKKC